ncbi:unnamed protein product [Closterium sp. Yama58-4]|nr:unnamed protein product [Closterium sp. Yama58-4]
MYAEDRNIVVLLDNASSHIIKIDDATSEDLFGFRTRSLGNRCWWHTGCIPRSWVMDLAHVGAAGINASGSVNDVNAALPIDLDEEIGDVDILIARLGLGPSAMPSTKFIAIDDDQPTCAEFGEDPLVLEPATTYSGASWEAPTSMQAVYEDENPETREARRTAREACEMLTGYAHATCITPCNIPPLNLNATPPPAPRPAAIAEDTQM